MGFDDRCDLMRDVMWNLMTVVTTDVMNYGIQNQVEILCRLFVQNLFFVSLMKTGNNEIKQLLLIAMYANQFSIWLAYSNN